MSVNLNGLFKRQKTSPFIIRGDSLIDCRRPMLNQQQDNALLTSLNSEQNQSPLVRLNAVVHLVLLTVVPSTKGWRYQCGGRSWLLRL
jgi:hypothetical protein